MRSNPWPLADEKRRLAVTLTGVAGFVDALGYLVLYRMYVANMSGNSVALGMRGGQGDWHEVLHRGLAVMAFVAGLIACDIMIESARRAGFKRVLPLALWLELICLSLFTALAWQLLGAHPQPSAHMNAAGAAMIMLAAFAMGAQNASLRSSGTLNVYTTHVTGTLTIMAQSAVKYLFWILDHRRRVGMLRTLRASWKHPSLQKMLLMLSLWICYVIGACLAGLGWHRFGIAPMLGPLLILIYFALREMLIPRQSRPISV